MMGKSIFKTKQLCGYMVTCTGFSAQTIIFRAIIRKNKIEDMHYIAQYTNDIFIAKA